MIQVQGLDRKFIKRLGIRNENVKVVWADYPIRYEDVSIRPYSRDTINVDYWIGIIALGNYNDLPALGLDYIAQESLKSG